MVSLGSSMRGVVLAGGTGSRLRPATLAVSKHLLLVGREPMVFHPIRKLREAGIVEIMLVTGTEHMGMMVQALGSGRALEVNLTYRVQDEPNGICGALSLCENFVDGGSFAAILGDNIYGESLAPYVERFVKFAGAKSWDARGMVLLARVPDPQRFGVAKFDSEHLVDIVEKPSVPPSDLCVTGCYLYAGSQVFNLIRDLRPSGRGELEVSDLNRAILEKGRLTWARVDGFWGDAGEFESLHAANRHLMGSGA